MGLDFAVAERQMFGTTYNKTAVDRLLDGRIIMSPHPEWRLPETIDWAADPFDDVNWQNQYHMLRWLDPLRRAAADGNDAAWEMWLRYVRDWVENNPRSRPATRWVWRDMVEGIRVIQLCLAAPLVRDRSPEDLTWLEATIRDHADFMSDPQNLGKANHAMHQHEALFVCGRILQDEVLTQRAVDRFDGLIEKEYDEQGVNREGAVAYHYNNYVWWERALRRLDAEGVPRPAAAERHARAPEEIAHSTRPDGTFVAIGDTDGGTPRTMSSPATDYVMSAGAHGEAPPDLLKIYDAGYVFARSGWGETERTLDEETFFSISFGRADRVHGHPDGGSITYSADTVNWVVDPGKYQYGYSVPRKHFLSRGAHSLVSIEGRTPRKDAEVRLVRRVETDRALDLSFEDDSFEGVVLTRRVVYSTSAEYLVVVDHVRSKEECVATQRWQLGPDVDATVGRNSVALASRGHTAILRLAGTPAQITTVRGQETPFDGWVSTGWKKKAEATAVLATKSGTSFRFIAVLAVGNGARPSVETVPVPSPDFCLRVDTGKTSEFILVSPDGVSFPLEAPASRTDDVPQVRVTPSPRPGVRLFHRDPDSRSEVFDLIERSRAAGWGASPEERRALGERLLDESRERGVDGPIDLGLQAGATDLLQIERGKAESTLVELRRTALVNWDAVPDWFPSFYPMPVRTATIGEPTSYVSEEPRIYSAVVGPLVLPFAVAPGSGDVLTVIFQGAIDRAKVRVPIFSRLRYQAELGAGPTVAIADPTLDLSSALRLGWYLGTETVDLPDHLARLVTEIASSLGTAHVVLAGSSGGGFAALQVGARIPGAVVVAASPQTDLRRYSVRLVNAAIEPAFGLLSVDDPAIPLERLSVAERMRKEGHFPRTVLVSNTGDSGHVVQHEGPLRAAFAESGESSRFSTVDVDLGPGHRPVGNEHYGRIMTDVYKNLSGSTTKDG